MAIFTTAITVPDLNGLGLDMFSFDVNDIANYANVTRSTTQIRFFDDANNEQVFTGTGFTFDINGNVTGGTITGYTFRENGVVSANITGLTVAAAPVGTAINNGDTFQFLSLMSAGNDTITGSALSDNLSFGDNAGTDTMNGLAGDDNIYGGLGADTINGGADADYLVGGAGNDTIDGGTGGDDYDTLGYIDEYLGEGGTQGITVNLSGITQGALLTERAIDTFGNTDSVSNFEDVQGTGFADTVYAASLVNNRFSFFGFAGNDTFFGTSGKDLIDYKQDERLAGIANANRGLSLVAHGITVNFSADAVAGNGASGTVIDSFGNTDTVSGVEVVRATFFVDTFNGGVDDEQFLGLKGADIINGGGGFDVAAYYDDRYGNGLQGGGLSGITANFSGDTLANGISVGTVVDGFGTIDQLTNIEAIDGTDFSDVMTGGADRVEFWAGQGDDTLTGGSADDELQGGDGTDTIHGGIGNDNLRGDEGGNFNQGNDQLFGEAGDDSFKGGAGSDLINGGADRDRVQYNLETTFTGDDATHGVIVNLSGVALTNVSVVGIANTTVAAGTAIDTRNYVDTLVSIEDVQGTGYDDIIVSSNSNSSLEGLEGNDKLTGGTGDDNLDGGAGNDTLIGGTGDNFFQGGAGTDSYAGGTLAGNNQFDKISYQNETGGNGIAATYTGGGNLTIIDTFGNTESATGIEQIKGSQYADLFTGSTGDDSAEGMGGGDTFNMGLGRDFVEYDHEVDAGTTQGVIINLSAAAISATLNNGLETVQAGRARDSFGATDILSGVENVGGTDFNDVIYGSSDDNNLKGENGTDIIHGGAGNDNIRGDEGGNFNQGNDQLFGDAGDDSFKGGAGNDLIDGGADRDQVQYNLETTFTGDDATHGVIVNISTAALTSVSVAGIALTNVAAGTAIDTRNYLDVLVSIEAVQGTGYNDIIVADVGENDLAGFEGADTLKGGLESDWLVGGAGNDILDGGIGGDDFDTLAYIDEYMWQGGNQGVTVNLSGSIQGGLASGFAVDAFGNTDTITNFEQVRGTGFADTVYVGAHGNSLFSFSGFLGNDTFVGSSGLGDRLDYLKDERDAQNANANLGLGLVAHGITVNFAADVIAGNGASGTVSDSFGNTDTVSGVEDVRGTFFVDTFNGGSDDEQFRGMKGADIINGGGGFDVAAYFNDKDGNGLQGGGLAGIIANFSADTTANGIAVGTVVDGYGTTDQLTNMDAINGTNFNDTFTGGVDKVEFWSGLGLDTFNGGSADDYADGGADNDSLNGGAGNDVLRGGAGGDSLNGGSNTGAGDTLIYDDSLFGISINLALNTAQGGDAQGDIISNFENITGSAFGDQLVGDGNANVLRGNAGNDLFVGGLGADTMIGGADLDVVDYSAFSIGVSVNLTTGTGPGGDLISEIENIIGSAFGDVLDGNNGANTMRGGAGNDFMVAGNGADLLIGGADNDEVSYETATTGVFVNLITGTGANGGVLQEIENIRGSNFGDVLQGDNGANTIRGLGGNDFIIAGNGADLIIGGADNDVVSYETATIGIFANLATGIGANGGVLQEIENITGSNFGDVILGSAGGNTLRGGAGNDYMVGDAGSDALFGGADNDVFRFETSNFGNDVIVDYQDNGDHISFGNAVATSFGQLTINGNGTTNVTVQIIGQSIVVQGLSNITLTASDFFFV